MEAVTKKLPSHLTPGNRGNSGGKKGRSGRKSNDFKAQVEAIRDEHGLPLLEQVLNAR